MFTIPILTLMYIGIAKAIEGQEEWTTQQFDLYKESLDTDRGETLSEKYWSGQANQD